MKGLLVVALLQLGCRERPCKPGTALVAIRFEGAAASATSVDLMVTVDGGEPRSGSFDRRARAGSDTVEIDFPGGYPGGKTVTLHAWAKVEKVVVAEGEKRLALLSGCTPVELGLGATAGGDLGQELDGSEPLGDLEIPPGSDLAMTPPADLAGADLTLGSDDGSPTIVDDLGVTRVPPVPSCPGTINTTPLQIVTLSGGGSDPDGGPVSFVWTVMSAPGGSTSTPTSPTSAGTNFYTDVAGSYTLRLTVTDDEAQNASCTVVVNAVAAEALRVELTWSTAFGDADLHLIQAGVAPATAWYQPSMVGEADCWWNNINAVWPPAGTAGDCNLQLDDSDGYGPEITNIVTSPASGNYEIGVAYFCSHSVPTAGHPIVAPGDGPTTATVTVHCNGAIIATYENIALDRTGQFVDVARVTWPDCVGQSVMTSLWTAQIQPAIYNGQAVHCQIACTQANAATVCTPGEKCAQNKCVVN